MKKTNLISSLTTSPLCRTDVKWPCRNTIADYLNAKTPNYTKSLKLYVLKKREPTPITPLNVSHPAKSAKQKKQNDS